MTPLTRAIPAAACAAVLFAACAANAAVPADPPYRARGNEPFWSLESRPSGVTFTLVGAPKVSAPPATIETTKGGRRLTTSSSAGTITAVVLAKVCADSMTGMPYPDTVTVSVGKKTYSGCGGEPASLLQGPPWTVTELGQTTVLPEAPVTMRFAAGGRVSGKASCNSFTGQYALTGEGLSFSKTATTRMMCPPAIAKQEESFLQMLGQVSRFEIRPDGSLALVTADGQQVVAHRR